MDWIVLILLIPMILVPAVLWFGFCGCNWFFGLDETQLEPPPVPPGNLVAILRLNEATNSLEVDLTWENNEVSGTVLDYRVERLVDGAADFEEIRRVTTLTHTDQSVPLDSYIYYRIRAANGTGVGDPSPVDLISTVFVTVFDSLNTLTTPQANVAGICIVQIINASHLLGNLPSGKGMIARIKMKGPTTGTLVLDRVYISQKAPASDPRNPGNPAPDVWDSLPATDPGGIKIEGGLTKVSDRNLGDAPVSFVPPTAVDPDANRVTLKLVSYALDPEQDLIIAFDVATTAGTGNLLAGTLTEVSEHFGTGPQAGVANRTAAFGSAANVLYLIEKIEVIKEQNP